MDYNQLINSLAAAFGDYHSVGPALYGEMQGRQEAEKTLSARMLKQARLKQLQEQALKTELERKQIGIPKPIDILKEQFVQAQIDNQMRSGALSNERLKQLQESAVPEMALKELNVAIAKNRADQTKSSSEKAQIEARLTAQKAPLELSIAGSNALAAGSRAKTAGIETGTAGTRQQQAQLNLNQDEELFPIIRAKAEQEAFGAEGKGRIIGTQEKEAIERLETAKAINQEKIERAKQATLKAKEDLTNTKFRGINLNDKNEFQKVMNDKDVAFADKKILLEAKRIETEEQRGANLEQVFGQNEELFPEKLKKVSADARTAGLKTDIASETLDFNRESGVPKLLMLKIRVDNLKKQGAAADQAYEIAGKEFGLASDKVKAQIESIESGAQIKRELAIPEFAKRAADARTANVETGTAKTVASAALQNLFNKELTGEGIEQKNVRFASATPDILSALHAKNIGEQLKNKILQANLIVSKSKADAAILGKTAMDNPVARARLEEIQLLNQYAKDLDDPQKAERAADLINKYGAAHYKPMRKIILDKTGKISEAPKPSPVRPPTPYDKKIAEMASVKQKLQGAKNAGAPLDPDLVNKFLRANGFSPQKISDDAIEAATKRKGLFSPSTWGRDPQVAGQQALIDKAMSLLK